MKKTTKQIFLVLVLSLLASVSVYAGGLDTTVSNATTFKDTLIKLAKVVAIIGLVLLATRYFMQTAENRTIPWGWIIAAIILGSIDDIMTMFGIAP